MTQEGEWTLTGLEVGSGLESHFVTGGCSPGRLQSRHPWKPVAGTIRVGIFHGALAARFYSSPFLPA